MLNGAELKRLMQTQAFAPVPFPIARAQLHRLMHGTFKDVLELPEETLQLLRSVQDTQKFRGAEIGLIRRDPREIGEKRDDKLFLHYNKRAETHYGPVLNKHPLLGGLFEELRPIYAAAVETFREIIACFEEDFPGVTHSFFPKDGDCAFYLRVLAYLGKDVLAQSHLDMSGGTLALAESDSGLFMGFNDSHSKEIVHCDKQAAFMAGLIFPEETSPLYAPTWHGVRQKPELARAKFLTGKSESELTLAERISRMAIVCFFHGSKRRSPRSYDENHQPHPYALARIRELGLDWEQLNLPAIA